MLKPHTDWMMLTLGKDLFCSLYTWLHSNVWPIYDHSWDTYRTHFFLISLFKTNRNVFIPKTYLIRIHIFAYTSTLMTTKDKW